MSQPAVQTGLKHALTEPGELAEKRSGSKSGRTAPSDSECSCETASLSCDSVDRPRAYVPPPTATGKNRSRRRGSEWEVLEGLKDGQRFEKRPEVFTGYLHKKRKWPLKGWHKRYFVIDGGILVYARSAGDVARGRLHGSVDVGLSVISAKTRRRRVDIDADEFIYHLRAKNNEIFRNWLHVLKAHRLYRQHLLTFGTRESAAKIHAPLIEIPPTENSSNATLSSDCTSMSTLTSEDSQTQLKKTLNNTKTSISRFLKPALSDTEQITTNNMKEKEKRLVRSIIELRKKLQKNPRPYKNYSISTYTSEENHFSIKSSQSKTTSSFNQFIKPLMNQCKNIASYTIKDIDKERVKSMVEWNNTVENDLIPLNFKSLNPEEQKITESKFSELIRLKRKSLRLRYGEDVSITNTSVGSSKNVKDSIINTDDDWLETADLSAVISSLVDSKLPLMNDTQTIEPPKNIVLKTNSGLSTFFLFAKSKHKKGLDDSSSMMKKSKKCTNVTKYQNNRPESPLPNPHSKCMLLGNHKLYKSKLKLHQETQVMGQMKKDKSQQKTLTIEEFNNLTDKLVVALFENKHGEVDSMNEDNIKTHITKAVEKLSNVATVIEPNPVKVIFKTLLEYWLKNTPTERKRSVLKNIKLLGRQEEALNAKLKSYKCPLITAAKTCKKIVKENELKHKNENQVQQIEQLLKNTVYFCETIRGNFREKDIDTTKKLIDYLDNKPNNNDSPTEMQEMFNKLLSESILPPDIAKEFLFAYLDLLTQKNSKSCSESSSQESIESINSKKGESQSSHLYSEFHTNVQTESIFKCISRSVSTLNRGSINEIKIVNSKDNANKGHIDPGQQYLKDLLDKLTSIITTFSGCASRKHPPNAEGINNKETNQYENDESVHEIQQSEPNKKIKNKINLEDIALKTDKILKETLKEKSVKSSSHNNPNIKLNKTQFWAPTPNPLFMKKDKNKRRPLKHNRVLSVTQDAKYKPFVNNVESDDSQDIPFEGNNNFRNTEFMKCDDPQSCYIMSSFKKSPPITNKQQMKKIKKVRLKECNGLVLSPKLEKSNAPFTSRDCNKDFTMFQNTQPKVIDERIILMLLENLVQLSTSVPALYKDINGLYIKLKKKYEKGSRVANSSPRLSLLGKIYKDDPSKSNAVDTGSQYDTDMKGFIDMIPKNVYMKEFAVNTFTSTAKDNFTQVQNVENEDHNNLALNLNKYLSSRPILVFQSSGMDLKQKLITDIDSKNSKNINSQRSGRGLKDDIMILKKKINKKIIKEGKDLSPGSFSITNSENILISNADNNLVPKISKITLKNNMSLSEKYTNENMSNLAQLPRMLFNSDSDSSSNQDNFLVPKINKLAFKNDKTLSERINNKKDELAFSESIRKKIGTKQTCILSPELLSFSDSGTTIHSSQENLPNTSNKELKEDMMIITKRMTEKSKASSSLDRITTTKSNKENNDITKTEKKAMKNDIRLMEKRIYDKIVKKFEARSPQLLATSDSESTNYSLQGIVETKKSREVIKNVSKSLEEMKYDEVNQENSVLSPYLLSISNSGTSHRYKCCENVVSETIKDLLKADPSSRVNRQYENIINNVCILSPYLPAFSGSGTTGLKSANSDNHSAPKLSKRPSRKNMMLLTKKFNERIMKEARLRAPYMITVSDSDTKCSNNNQQNNVSKLNKQSLQDDIKFKKVFEKRIKYHLVHEFKGSKNTEVQTDQGVHLPVVMPNTFWIKSSEFLGATMCDASLSRCKSVPSTSSGATGLLAGFVSGTPGGKLASWIVETGAAPLESASRELGQAQLSIQQLQRVYDALEMHTQVHHDIDASVDGATSLVKKDRRKFGLRKKKSSVKGSSVDLNSHHNLEIHSGHSGISALTAPPSPGGGASSLPSSAASLPIACAAARPQSLVEVNSGPGSLTADHHLREDFLLHAREVLQSLNNVLTTLVKERTRVSSLVAGEGGDTFVTALRNNLNTAIVQNNELRSRLSRIHDASDIAEITSMGANSEQCNRALSYSSSCVSASEFYDAEEHKIPAEEIESGVIELDGDSSSEVGSLSSEDEVGSHGDSSDNSEPAHVYVSPPPPRRPHLPAPRPPGGPSLWNLLYKNIGKDLSQISMPVSINEPLNMLQRLCEELEYCSLLDRAAMCTDELTRAALIATFAVSAYGAAGHRAASKPFNPLLGETYECIREDRGFKFIAEQVSHHPPISACYAESPTWTFWQEARIKTKFWGKSMEFQPAGRVHVRLHTTGDHYSWNKVTTCVHNLFGGQRWVDQYGDMHVVCHTSDITAKLSFIKASSWSTGRHEVRGIVQGTAGRLRVSGSWTGGVTLGDSPRGHTAWTPDPMPPNYEMYYGFTKFAMELNELETGMKEILPYTDTRLRPDQRALEEGDIESAERYKSQLEQAQRDRRSENPHHTPAWFRKAMSSEGEEMWVYNGEYWSSREAGFPTLTAPRLW